MHVNQAVKHIHVPKIKQENRKKGCRRGLFGTFLGLDERFREQHQMYRFVKRRARDWGADALPFSGLGFVC